MPLILSNINIKTADKIVCSNISLSIQPGEINALIGPNGSGKSSLAYAIAGHPEYQISSGSLRIGKTSLLTLSPEERHKMGVFLSFQEPPEIGGIEVGIFLKEIIRKREKDEKKRRERFEEIVRVAKQLHLREDFLSLPLQKGFSGGEKKKCEILQLLASRPRFAILDELDAGLDADSLHSALDIVRRLTAKENLGVLFITHHIRIFSDLKPQTVSIINDGKIVMRGNYRLAKKIEKNGLQKLLP